MIRYKILGTADFDNAPTLYQNNINYDLGHFAIGANFQEICFEEIIPPPKQLWFQAKITFSKCDDVAVLQKNGSSFVWQNDDLLCQKVSITPLQIIHGQNLEHINWQLVPSVFEHQFTTVASIYSDIPGTIRFWPCGGKVSDNLLEIEQMYAQVSGLEQKVYLNNLNACSKLIAKSSSNSKFLMHPPAVQKLSLAEAINQGTAVFKVTDGYLEYLYQSIAYENQGKLQILCERKNQ